MENCVFCKIVAGEIPSAKVYEDEEMLVFKDARTALVGRMLEKIAAHKDAWGLAEGYRLVVNQGENAGQTVHHLHIHVLGGETLPWE